MLYGKALHAALTNELSVIQGPPGTGKTFIALKIVETLINNQEMKEPILVISLTNHALDQFLVGILNVTDSIVRIGGQSKHPELEKRYNLKSIRRRYCLRSKYDDELEKLHMQMKSLLDRIELIKNCDGILPFNFIEQIVQNFCSKFSDPCSWLLDSDVAEYLSGDNDIISFSEIKSVLQSKFRKLVKDADPKSHVDTYMIAEFKLLTENLFQSIDELKTNLESEEPYKQFALKNFNIDKIPQKKRTKVYKYWTNSLLKFYEQEKEVLAMKIRVLTDEVEKLRWNQDVDILKNFKVIGMTTNGAARLHKLLQRLQCRRVIVEEAAEVMECQIISCLNLHCEQLILIGDHKQLRPNISVYELGKNYNFDVSLFERLVLNGINCQTLQVQHRMAPEIATLIVPSIYPTLFNDDSVLTRKCIEGFQDKAKRMFFITHSQPEQQDSEIRSRRNEHEGDFIVALCAHLVMQGYSPDQITILSAYKGQMFYIKRKLPAFVEGTVNNTVVDNYQGEENDIILLSLVRSNDEQRIGFLASENRVCVALSRARNALYCIGNMDLLCSKSELWRKIRASFQALTAIGNALPLRCTIHPEETCSVSCAKDFEALSPFGGCKQICTFELKCGHMCGRTCHTVDQKHEEMKCLSTNLCKRICAANLHFCKKYCVENCGECMVNVEKELPCGHKLFLQCGTDPKLVLCEVMVEKTFEKCQHVAIVPCHEIICPMDCAETLKCGHICDRKCHISKDPEHHFYRCKQPCTKISKSCSQDHICKRLCYENCSSCEEVIEKELNCGHSVKMFCGGVPECTVKVTKLISECNHSIKIPCYKTPTRQDCTKKCDKKLKCGHHCVNMCKEPCIELCSFVVENVGVSCGHKAPLLCSEKSQGISNFIQSENSCQEVCGKLLECGHSCKEKCSSCSLGRFHAGFCQEKCERILVCGQRCNLKCGMPCSVCSPFTCKHVTCNQTTCHICFPFKEMHYKKKCTHHDCSKTCTKKECNRSPCNYNCERLLVCGHVCSGLCGEVCPKLCWTCHREKLILESMSSNTVKNPRFYVLPDCNHVIEITCLEKWFDWQDSVIRCLTCPICNVRVTSSLRYNNAARKVYSTLKIIQDMLNVTPNQIHQKYSKLTQELHSFDAVCIKFGYGQTIIKLKTIIRTLCKDSSKSSLNLHSKLKILEIADFILDGVKHVMFLYRSKCVSSDQQIYLENILHNVLDCLDKASQVYNIQTAADISLEMLKFYYLENGFKVLKTKDSKDALKKLMSIPRRFTIEVQKECLELIKSNVQNFEMPKFAFKMSIPRQSLQSYWFKCSKGHINPICYVRDNEKIKFCRKCERIVSDIECPTFPASENKEDQYPLFCNNKSSGNNRRQNLPRKKK